MNILIQLNHPAHFHLYKNVIQNLKRDGHLVYILIKKKDVLEDLLKSADIPYINILPKGRKSSLQGLFYGLLVRIGRIFIFTITHKIDILAGSSSEIAPVAKLLRRRSIITVEDDAAVIPQLVNFVSPFLDGYLTPVVCDNGKVDSRSTKYPSYHELAYLHPNHFTADRSVVEKYFSPDAPYFILRFAQLTAYHDVGKNGINTEVAQNLIDILLPHGKVYISSERPLESQFEQYRLRIDPLDMLHVMAFADIYIGDSQTMAAESGVMGVPFVRFNDFVGKIGYLRELEEVYQLGYGVKTNEQERLYQVVKDLIAIPDRKELFGKRRLKMLSEKIDYAQFLTKFIEDYPASKTAMDAKPDYKDMSKIQNPDFTQKTYKQLLEYLIELGYSFLTFEEYCLTKPEGKLIILRHDVDKKPGRSLDLARIEHQLGIKASYYFRIVPESNQPEFIKAIAQLGHEIGYHYEDLSLSKGDRKKAYELYRSNLAYFRNFYPVKTISMHGSPTSRYDNRDIWQSYDYHDYDIIGEPYFDFIKSQINEASGDMFYFTDTGRMWDGNEYNVRDKAIEDLSTNKVKVHSTQEILDFLQKQVLVKGLMINTHPQRWTDNKIAWTNELLAQKLKNVVKKVLIKRKG